MMNFINKLPFAHHSWFMYLRLLLRHFIEDDCTQKAASLTYTALLSLVPILTVILVIFSSVPALEGVREQVQNAIYSNLMPSSSAAITAHMNDFAQKSSNLGIIGVAGVFVTTIMTLITIETAFNKIWRVQERSGGMASIIRYWTMITLAPIILGVAFGASSAIQGISFMNQRFAGYAINWAVWAQIVSFLFTIAGFVAMYWFIPKVKVPIKNAVIAGIITAILFETLRQIFGTVMSNFTSYETIYGAFAAIPVFLMWIYLSWNLILLGVEISYTLTIFDNEEVPVHHPLLSLLDMLHLAYKKYQNSQTVSEAELRSVLGRKELPKWNLYIDELVKNELIMPTKNDDYVLRTDLSTVSLWQLYKNLPYPLPIKDELDRLKESARDPWFDRLFDNLYKIEGVAKEELKIPLSNLFLDMPLREKEPIVAILDNEGSENSDKEAFDHEAKRTVDSHGNSIVIPEGQTQTKPNESDFGKIITTAKKGWHWYKRGKDMMSSTKDTDDIKR